MNSEKLISFIVPVYNAEKTLETCVESVLVQQERNLAELILVNDGSSDASQTIIDRYASEYPNIVKSIAKENGGPGSARNEGIRNASGKYITFLDSDDTLEPEYLSVVSDAIKMQHPDLIIIDYNRIYQKKQGVFERWYKFNKRVLYSDSITIQSNPEIIATAEVAAWLRIIKRDILLSDERLLFSDNKLGEDLEAVLKWYLKVEKIAVLNRKLYNYVIRPYSLNFSAYNLLDFLRVQESVSSYYEEKGMLLMYKSQLEYLFTKHLLISGLMRLWTYGKKDSYVIFLKLRNELMVHFPKFHNNKFLSVEPWYLRLSLIFCRYTPIFFRFIG